MTDYHVQSFAKNIFRVVFLYLKFNLSLARFEI